MSEKTLKILIYTSGIICFFCLVAIRFEAMFNSVLEEPVVEGYWDKTKYGELYYFSMINHFKEEGLPPAQLKFEHSDKQAVLNDAEIMTFGDSFFEISRNPQVPQRLSEDFNKKVHFKKYDFPLEYLSENNYSDTTPKLLIFERVERYIPVAFQKKHQDSFEKKKSPGFLKKAFDYVIGKVFYGASEELLDAMLKRSYLSTNIYKGISTFKFDRFGYISSLTPKYLVQNDSSWLFYHDQVNDEITSFYYNHSEEDIANICDNMKSLADDLKKKYNITVLYLPLPAKYTLYHNLINNDEYNQFLPKLYKGLDERGVKYVNVYEEYLKSDSVLFYRTDGHWNKNGIDLTYNKLTKYLRSDSTLSHFIQDSANN